MSAFVQDWAPFLALLVMLLCSAFFSSAETALIGSRRVKLQALAERGDRRAALALRLLRDPGDLLATLLVGNNIVNVGAAALGTALFGPFWATVIITLAVLMVGEIPPKTIAAQWPEKTSLVLSRPVRVFQIALTPIVWLTSHLTDLILWPFNRRLGSPARRFFSREEFKTALDESQDAGELEPGEVQMVQEVLDLTKIRIGQLMIPRAEAAVLSWSMSREEVLAEVRRRRFSRYPVFKENQPRPVGILHIKDLLLAPADARWQSLLRALPFKPQDMDADDLLRNMQIARFHMAAVVDEEREVVGFITLERLIEEIVGEIADEHETEADPIKAIDIGIYRVRADLAVADVALLLNLDIDADDRDISIDAYYKKQTGGVSASVLRLGAGMIRPGKNGYLLFLFDGQAFEEHGHSAFIDEEEFAFAPGKEVP